jgi:hypothetical protein
LYLAAAACAPALITDRATATLNEAALRRANFNIGQPSKIPLLLRPLNLSHYIQSRSAPEKINQSIFNLDNSLFIGYIYFKSNNNFSAEG